MRSTKNANRGFLVATGSKIKGAFLIPPNSSLQGGGSPLFRVWHQFLALPRDDRYPGYAPGQYSSLVADVVAKDAMEAQAVVEKMYGGWARCRVFYASRLDNPAANYKTLKIRNDDLSGGRPDSILLLSKQ